MKVVTSVLHSLYDTGRTVYHARPHLLHALIRGRPEFVLSFDGGLGDDLLCTAVARELRTRRARSIWMITSCPDLFRANDDFSQVLPKNTRSTNKLLGWLKLPVTKLRYAPDDAMRVVLPESHVITTLCQRMGIAGQVDLRPYMTLSGEEKRRGAFSSAQLAIQASGLSAKYPATTKEWYPARFQEVVDYFRQDFQVIQIGGASDPPLRHTLDLRGKTTIRETAGILANSIVFIGLAGFLQHLARSVDCRAVVVYGGRELPNQTGYSCNVNLVNRPECSPCGLYHGCPYGMKCMDAIGVEQVVSAAVAEIQLHGKPLAVDTALLPTCT